MSKKSKKQRKKERALQASNRAAAIAAANKNKPVKPATPPEPKTQFVKCYEIHFSLIDSGERLQVSGQYFHQPKGQFQGIMDAFAYVHRYVELERAKSDKLLAIEKVTVYEWALAIPGPRGVINSKKFKDPIFSWTHTGKIKNMAGSLNKKQNRRVQTAAVYLDKWRPMKVRVVIEDITQEATLQSGSDL